MMKDSLTYGQTDKDGGRGDMKWEVRITRHVKKTAETDAGVESEGESRRLRRVAAVVRSFLRLQVRPKGFAKLGIDFEVGRAASRTSKCFPRRKEALAPTASRATGPPSPSPEPRAIGEPSGVSSCA